MISYTIIHPYPVFFYGTSRILENVKPAIFSSKGYVQQPKEALHKLNDWIADLMIIGIFSKNQEEIRLIEAIKKKSKRTNILMVAELEYSDIVRMCFIKGANGYLLPHFTEETLIHSIDRMFKNEVVMPVGFRIHPDIQELQSIQKLASRYDFHLTHREKEVLALICKGMSNKSIAQQLFISDQTVAVHRKNLFRKLEVKNSISLMQVAKERKLIT